MQMPKIYLLAAECADIILNLRTKLAVADYAFFQ